MKARRAITGPEKKGLQKEKRKTFVKLPRESGFGTKKKRENGAFFE